MGNNILEISDNLSPTYTIDQHADMNLPDDSIFTSAVKYAYATNFTGFLWRQAKNLFDDDMIQPEELKKKFNIDSKKELSRTDLNYRLHTRKLAENLQGLKELHGVTGNYDASSILGLLAGAFLDPAAIVLSFGVGSLVSGGIKVSNSVKVISALQSSSLPVKLGSRLVTYGSAEVGANIGIGQAIAGNQEREYGYFDYIADGMFGAIFGTVFPVGLNKLTNPREAALNKAIVFDTVPKHENAFNPARFVSDANNTTLDSVAYFNSFIKEPKKFIKLSAKQYKELSPAGKEKYVKSMANNELDAPALTAVLDIVSENGFSWNVIFDTEVANLVDHIRVLGLHDVEYATVLRNIIEDPKIRNESGIWNSQQFYDIAVKHTKSGEFKPIKPIDEIVSKPKESVEFNNSPAEIATTTDVPSNLEASLPKLEGIDKVYSDMERLKIKKDGDK